MAEKVSAAERPRGAGSSCSGSSSGSETLSEEGEPGAGPAAGRRRPGEEPGSPGEREEAAASLEERDEELDHILSPPPMPFRKSSNPEVISGPGKPFKFKRQLSEDGRQLRRGSLGGALTGRYLLPSANGQQLWQPAETSNLVRMRCQALGQSAPSLTASLVRHALLLSAKAVLLAEQDCKDDFIHVAFRVQVQKELSLPRRGSLFCVVLDTGCSVFVIGDIQNQHAAQCNLLKFNCP